MSHMNNGATVLFRCRENSTTRVTNTHPHAFQAQKIPNVPIEYKRDNIGSWNLLAVVQVG